MADLLYNLVGATESYEVLVAKALNSTATVYSRPFATGGADLFGLYLNVTAASGSPNFNVDWQVSPDGETWVNGAFIKNVTVAGAQYEERSDPDDPPSWAYYARLKFTGQTGNGNLTITCNATITRKL